MMETIVPIAIILVLALGLVGRNQYRIWRRRRRRTNRSGIDGSTPVPDQLRIISPHYGLFSRSNHTEYVDWVKRFGGNAIRVFAYHEWDEGKFVPWDGDNPANLTRLDRIREVIETANERGIWIVLTLFQNNDGFGRGVVARDRGELAEYIKRIVSGTVDLAVIYESTNEDDNHGFNLFVLDEIRKHIPAQSLRTCAYHNPALGADWTNYHTGDLAKYDNRGFYRIILSNDTPSAIRGPSDEDYIRWVREANAIRPIGSFEILTAWKRLSKGEEGFCGNDIPEMERQWGRVLEAVRDLP